MRINRWIVPALAIFFLLGSVAVAKPLGWWQTTGVSLTTIDDVSPEDIRGSSSLADLSRAFGIPHAELLTVLGLPQDIAPETQLKELEAYNEVSTVRGLVAEHLGLPWEWEEEHETAPAEASGTLAAEEPTTPDPTTSWLPAAEIKGSMTLQGISDECGIPLDVLYAELGLAKEIAPGTALRDLREKVSGFEVSVVRDVVAAYQAKQ